MSPNVSFAAQYLPFDAADYTWIDLKSALFIDAATVEAFLTEKKIDKADIERPESFKDLPLPFEKFALIPPEVTFGSGPVVTIHRKETEMLVSFWQMGVPESTVDIVVYHDGEKEMMRIRYDKRLKVAKLGAEKIQDKYNDLLQDLFLYIMRFSVGMYGNTYEAHTCKGDTQLNARRKKKNKKPLYDWTTVVLQMVKKTESKGGSHASPRQHDVRGHYVKSKLGKLFWRKAHKRGDPTLGTVFHDYVVRSDACPATIPVA